jgi:hypothetical protein
MDSETKASPKLAAIRTYAKDLDEKRHHKSKTESAPTEEVVVVAPVAAEPVRASDTLTAEVTRVTAPKVNPLPQKPVAEPAGITEPKKATAVPALKPITPTKKDPTLIVDNEDAAAATIITDTKRGQFKLFPAIINAMRSWFSTTKKNYTAKKIPKYTVPDTTRRKGIIQKATSKTGKFASSDFSSIQERILERKAAAAKAQEITEGPETIWTANTEPGFALLSETTVPQYVSNVQVVARKSFRTIPEEVVITKTDEVAIPTPEAVNEVADERWSTPTPTVPAPEVAIPTVVPEEEVLEIETSPLPPAEVPIPEEEVPEPKVTAVTEEVETEEISVRKSRFDVLKVNTNTLTFFVSAAVVVLAMLGTAGYLVLYKDGSAPTHTSAPDTLLTNTEVRTLVLYTVTTNSITEAFNALQNERGTTQGVFMYTSTIGSTEAVLPAQILSALEIDLAPDLAQTIGSVRVGYINQAPYILLKVKNESAARGGLLLWEAEMYRDLSSLLSLAPETTETFLDATISGTDVRVLKNSNGSERLLYGIKNGTILITTNSASYAQLTTLLK